MNIEVPAGKYVVAVSGGVDSVVLLHLIVQLKQSPNYQLVVAHFDHGIRADSAEDRIFVGELAHHYGLPFVYDQAKLGKGASEAVAREARYAFLKKVSKAMRADAIITAHHQDDQLETIVINIIRGTKSRGLSSLRSSKGLLRPLLPFAKSEILAYAKHHKLKWHEDSTNTDDTYLRNYIRHRIMSRLEPDARRQILEHSEKAAVLNGAITELTSEYLTAQPAHDRLDRAQFRTLPEEVGLEVLAQWLRGEANAAITTKLLQRLVDAIQNGRNNSRVDVAKGYSLQLGRDTVTLLYPQ